MTKAFFGRNLITHSLFQLFNLRETAFTLPVKQYFVIYADTVPAAHFAWYKGNAINIGGKRGK